MKIAVLGTGMVGRALAGKLAMLGHDVAIGTRDPAATRARQEGDAMGNPPFSTWSKANPSVQLATFAQAAEGAKIIVNATNGHASLPALQAAGDLAGKIIVDVANPLDFSKGMPPSLFVSNTESLAEQIQEAFPTSKVVKTLNTLTAPLMVDPERLAGGDHTVIVSGNDAGAKKEVGDLLRSFGWKHILDLGDITTARGTEMWLPLWVRIYAAKQTPMFNLKIVTDTAT